MKLALLPFRAAGRRRNMLVACLAFLFCTAPTPGDVGGCGQKPAELDPTVFFVSKADIDCQRCRQCDLHSATCTLACDSPERYPANFPDRCAPLVHDGEVCLHALQYASCSDYGSYVSDTAPSTASECNFCPEPAP